MANHHPSEQEPDPCRTIAEELVADTSSFSAENIHLLRQHGVFQQDNRDERGVGRDLRRYEFMLRLRTAGGKLTASQLLGLLDVADEHSAGWLQITSRQGIQLTGVAKSALRSARRSVADLGLATLSTGGDIVCNVMCCPAPHVPGGLQDELQATADQVAACLMPRLDDCDDIGFGRSPDPRATAQPTFDKEGPRPPVDARAKNPRKFKIGIAVANDNCTDVYAQDLGLLAVTEGARVVGYNVLVGGNMRNSLSVFARSATLASPLAYVSHELLLPLVRSISAVYRKYGDCSDRNRVRLKYLIQAWGLERFKLAVEHEFGRSLAPPRPLEITGREDHLGWHPQNDREWFLGLHVANGCVGDAQESKLKSALRAIAGHVSVRFRLTPQRNILVCDIPPSEIAQVNTLLDQYGLRTVDELSHVRRYSSGCPGLPHCRAAITESQRLLDEIIDQLEMEVARLGLEREKFSLAITGCGFGCTRSHLADIALVGRAVDRQKQTEKYAIFLGGDRLGRRLNTLYQDLIPADQIVPTLRSLLHNYRCQRLPGESFGDFYFRIHHS